MEHFPPYYPPAITTKRDSVSRPNVQPTTLEASSPDLNVQFLDASPCAHATTRQPPSYPDDPSRHLTPSIINISPKICPSPISRSSPLPIRQHGAPSQRPNIWHSRQCQVNTYEQRQISYSQVTPEQYRPLLHDCICTYSGYLRPEFYRKRCGE